MKKLIIFVALICVICSGCGEQATTQTNSKDDAVAIGSFKDIVNTDTFVSYLESVFTNVTFEVREKTTDYYDEYFGMDMQESAYIVGLDENSFEVLNFTLYFMDDKVVDFSATVNVTEGKTFDTYKGQIEELMSYTSLGMGMTEGELVELTEKIFDFDSYKENVYENGETYFNVGEYFCLGVEFEGGKDFLFEGTTYYFILSSIA